MARAGLASAQGPVGKPRGHAGATFCATPVPGATTPTGCPTLTNVFFKLCWVFFRVQYYLVVSCGPKEPRGGALKVAGTSIVSFFKSSFFSDSVESSGNSH